MENDFFNIVNNQQEFILWLKRNDIDYYKLSSEGKDRALNIYHLSRSNPFNFFCRINEKKKKE